MHHALQRSVETPVERNVIVERAAVRSRDREADGLEMADGFADRRARSTAAAERLGFLEGETGRQPATRLSY